MTETRSDLTTDGARRVDRSAYVKDAIRVAAEDLFAKQGFERTGVREIAAIAGVNPAIVIRHFGSKERLFLDTMTVPLETQQLLDAPLAELGRAVVRWVLDAHARGSLDVYGALLGAASRPEVRARLQEYLTEGIIPRLAHRIDTDHEDLRVRLFTAQIQGLLTMLSLNLDPGLAADPEAVVALYGDSLQRILTP